MNLKITSYSATYSNTYYNIILCSIKGFTKTSNMTDEQKEMQKTNNLMLPIMSGIIAYTMPLALGVYWLFGNILQIIQQLIISKITKPKGEVLKLNKGGAINEKSSEQYGKTVEEAIRKGLEELKVSRDDVKVEILEEPSNGGILGMISAKMAKVRVTVDKKISDSVAEKQLKK